MQNTFSIKELNFFFKENLFKTNFKIGDVIAVNGFLHTFYYFEIKEIKDNYLFFLVLGNSETILTPYERYNTSLSYESFKKVNPKKVEWNTIIK